MTGHRIALISDDEAARALAQRALEELGGYQVLASDCGQQAIAKAAAFRPYLVLLDVSAPGADAAVLLRIMRNQPTLKYVPLVFLTAQTQARQMAHFRTLGAADVIAKPFDPQNLCDRAAEAIAGPETVPAALEHMVDLSPLALVIEDDPSIRFLLGFILKQQGWRVTEAHDGEQGYDAIMQGQVADAVLMDIVLPGIDGLQLLDVLRGTRRWSRVPVIMLTSKGDETSVRRALAAGANDYVAKPFDTADLLARLNRARPPGPA